MDARLLEFQAQVVKDDKVAPDMTYLRGFFNINEMKSLWGRLATAQGNADVSIKTAWEELSGLSKENKKASTMKHMKDKALG